MESPSVIRYSTLLDSLCTPKVYPEHPSGFCGVSLMGPNFRKHKCYYLSLMGPTAKVNYVSRMMILAGQALRVPFNHFPLGRFQNQKAQLELTRRCLYDTEQDLEDAVCA